MRKTGVANSASLAALLCAGAMSLAEANEPQTAQTAPSPASGAQVQALLLGKVLETAQRHFPSVLEALAQREAAQGRALAAQGAFDAVVGADSQIYADGFYDGRALATKVEKPFAPLGASLYGSYRLSRGDFPIYEDEFFTNRAGEVKVGVALSLLRDRDIDERRFRRLDAGFTAESTEFDLALARVKVQHQAMRAYFDWVLAGHRLRVYRELLQVANERQAGLTSQVERGARARLILIENQQNILRRQMLVEQADQAQQITAARLSLFLRDEAGAPAVPSAEAVPALRDLPHVDIAEAIAQSQDAAVLRPELGALRIDIARAQTKARLARNDLQPRLDLRYELGRDVGRIGLGGISRDGTESVIGVKLSQPLGQRSARGRLTAADAERRALELSLQRTAEFIAVEIESLRVEAAGAERLAMLAGQEVTQARQIQAAERRLFETGASDFFRLNQREELTADAEVRRLTAELRKQSALADLYAATVNLARLGLA